MTRRQAMALYLVQHGKSLSKEIDPGQGLSEEGAAETGRMARLAIDLGLKVGGILHSGKTRARQTAEILAAVLDPAASVKEALGLNPLDDVVPWSSLNPGDRLLLVGHLPFMERLAGLLVTGSQGKLVIRFQNSGIVCLDREEGSAVWMIRWALVPRLG
jgi:phosphohistidine phosphatase